MDSGAWRATTDMSKPFPTDATAYFDPIVDHGADGARHALDVRDFAEPITETEQKGARAS